MEETMTPHYAAAGDGDALITALTRIRDSLAPQRHGTGHEDSEKGNASFRCPVFPAP
jgi:hypothetical protein